MTISLKQNLMKMDTTTETKRQKAIEQELGCKFIRVYPDKEDFDIFWANNEIFRHIKQPVRKTLINKILRRLLPLEFKSDNIPILKAIKFMVEKILPDYK